MNDQPEPMDFNAIVGRNIAAARKARGWSQGDLAAALGLRGISFQQQTVLKVEKGVRPLKLEEAVQIADLLGIEMGELLAVFGEEVQARTMLLEARGRWEVAMAEASRAQAAVASAAKQLADAEAEYDKMAGGSSVHIVIRGDDDGEH